MIANYLSTVLGEQNAATKYIQDCRNAARVIFAGYGVGTRYHYSTAVGRESRLKGYSEQGCALAQSRNRG
jgi:hypothetical protein